MCKKKVKKLEKRAKIFIFKENLKERPKGRLTKVGQNLCLIPHSFPIPKFGVFSAGILLGEIKGKTLVPSHQFFSAYGKLFKLQRILEDENEAKKYLRGEELASKGLGGTGFCSIIYNSSVIGGGKASGVVIKNHYPKGLRLK